jgi:ribosomal protein S27E
MTAFVLSQCPHCGRQNAYASDHLIQTYPISLGVRFKGMLFLRPAFLLGEKHEFAVRCQHCNQRFKMVFQPERFGISCQHCHKQFSVSVQEILENQIKCDSCGRAIAVPQEEYKDVSMTSKSPTDTVVVPGVPLSSGEEKLVEYFQDTEVKLHDAITSEARQLITLSFGLAGLLIGSGLISVSSKALDLSVQILGIFALLPLLIGSIQAYSATYRAYEMDIPIADLARLRDLACQLLRMRGTNLLQARLSVMLGAIGTLFFLFVLFVNIPKELVYAIDFILAAATIALKIEFTPLPPAIQRSRPSNRLAVASVVLSLVLCLSAILLGKILGCTTPANCNVPFNVSLLFTALSLICGGAAFWLGLRAYKIAKSEKRSKILAGCGIGCGFLWLLFGILAAGLAIVSRIPR